LKEVLAASIWHQAKAEMYEANNASSSSSSSSSLYGC